MKRMKKQMAMCALIVSLCSALICVKAATFTLSSSTTQVNPGGSFTVTVSVPGSGMFFASASNATISPSSQYCDTTCVFNATASTSGTSASVSVSAGQAGTMNEVTAFEDDSCIEGTKTINVSIKQAQANKPNNNASSTSKPQVDKRSNDNSLASLSISNGKLTPSFQADITEYKVDLNADVNKLQIEGKANHLKASVKGNGEHALEAGENKIDIQVVAENGSVRTYTIIANVDEKPIVYLPYNDTQLGVVRNVKNVEVLNGFKETTLSLKDQKIKAWYSEKMDQTIVYLIDEKTNEKNFYIYDTKKKEVKSVIKKLTIVGKQVYAIEIDEENKEMAGFTYTDVTVDEMSLKGWKYNDPAFANYTLIYVMDENGNTKYYMYEVNENTLQLYNGAAAITQKEYESVYKKMENAETMKMICMVLSAIFMCTTIALSWIVLKQRNKIK